MQRTVEHFLLLPRPAGLKGGRPLFFCCLNLDPISTVKERRGENMTANSLGKHNLSMWKCPNKPATFLPEFPTGWFVKAAFFLMRCLKYFPLFINKIGIGFKSVLLPSQAAPQ